MSLQRRINAVLLLLITILRAGTVNVFAVHAPYRMISNSEMKIALTFDDGPHSEYTEEILDILDEFGIKATFFVIGRNCDDSPKVIERVISCGHEVGNHTYSHPSLKKITGEELKNEIIKTEELLYERCSYRPKLFRPPEGVYTKAVEEAISGLDYLPILWTVDTEDWLHPSSEKIAETVMKNVSAGKIILCHDYISGKSSTPKALRIFIPKLLNQGYNFVTVSELLESEQINCRKDQ